MQIIDRVVDVLEVMERQAPVIHGRRNALEVQQICCIGRTVDVHAEQISVTREVARTVEMQHVHCIDRIVNVPGTPVSGIQEVLKTVGVPKFKNIDRDVPAVRLRQAQVPIVKTVQKMVDVPVGCDVRFRRSRKRTER